MKFSPLRKISTALLLTAFLVQTFSKPFIVADYYVNTPDYAKNCINKLVPMMHCNGKCQMMKKLQEQEKKEQESSERKLNGKTEVLSSNTSFASGIYLKVYPAKRVYAGFLTPLEKDLSFDIFHPPGSVSFAS